VLHALIVERDAPGRRHPLAQLLLRERDHLDLAPLDPDLLDEQLVGLTAGARRRRAAAAGEGGPDERREKREARSQGL